MLPCGTCFRILERKFVTNQSLMMTSPQMYVPYDSSTAPNLKYFRESILNSLPEDYDRPNFLNEFHQCLMAGRMPHKDRKLAAKSPKGPRKTKWASVFLGIISMNFVASIIEEAESFAIYD